jgi:cytochrome c peroxidase
MRERLNPIMVSGMDRLVDALHGRDQHSVRIVQRVSHDAAVETLREIEGYRLQFDRIFDDGLTIDNVGRAIATFERALVTGPAPADYYEPLRAFREVFAEDLEDLEFFKEEEPDLYEQYLEMKDRSEQHPMSEAAKRGREIFFTDRGRCTACHTGANFTDEEFHNLGVGMDQDEPDLGRYLVTGVEEDRGAFKTPTIRNVELTAPYMHDGSLDTLEEVVEFYDEGGISNPWLSEDMQELNLTDQEKADLVEYMKALTSELPKVEMGRLPQ